MATEESEESRHVVSEFVHLLEKSKQLFNGLKDVPLAHGIRHWQGYFGCTFDVFTQLWRFQQQHRAVLESSFGLKRWQIGDIASKIGQLYYHYYLRTSDMSYLQEAFSFYVAIRTRGYYAAANIEKRQDLMVKQLRYYGRFIVVCLLLRKMRLARELVQELQGHADAYHGEYDDSVYDWMAVVEDVRAFIHADNLVHVLNADAARIVLSHRLNIENNNNNSGLKIREAVIVGSQMGQAKFSEITIDMFRIMQSLEREPTMESVEDTNSLKECAINGENNSRNPRKHILYKPCMEDCLVVLAACVQQLGPQGALLIYISAQGHIYSDQHTCSGGLALRPHWPEESKSQSSLSPSCLHPSDLQPFTRRPLILIIDSDQSNLFLDQKSLFRQPFLALLSPQCTPHPFDACLTMGSLYTLFLHSPLSAFCHVANVVDMPLHIWDKSTIFIETFVKETTNLISASNSIDSVFLAFFNDDFARILVCRHVFAHSVLSVHPVFAENAQNLPKISPQLPSIDVLGNHALQRIVLELANFLEVRHVFADAAQID